MASEYSERGHPGWYFSGLPRTFGARNDDIMLTVLAMTKNILHVRNDGKCSFAGQRKHAD